MIEAPEGSGHNAALSGSKPSGDQLKLDSSATLGIVLDFYCTI